MKAKNQITTEWYSMIREFLLIFSVQYGIFKCINWEVPSLLLFLTSLFMVLSIKFVKTYRMRKITFLLLILFLLVILVLIVFYHINVFLFIKDALFWNYAYFMKSDGFHISYCILTVCILSVVIMKIILYVEKNIIAEFITSLGLFVFMVICAMYNIQWNPIIIGIMLFCCLDIIVEIFQVRAGRTEKYSERCLVPFLAAAVLLTICIPSKQEPIKWTWVKHAVSSIEDNIQQIVYNFEYIGDDEKNEFSVNRVGLSETKTNFGGNLIDTKGRSMLLVEPKNDVKIGYLNGIVRSKYTGNGWDETEESNYAEEYKMDLYEKLYNLYYSDLKPFPDQYFAKRLSFKIGFQNISTKTVFRPENSYSIDSMVDGLDVNAVGDNVYFSEKQKKGYCYYVSALIMNMKNDNMKQYLEGLGKNQGYDEENKVRKIDLEGSAFEEAVNQLGLKDNQITDITSDYFRNLLAERSKKIKEEYLQIPEETPDRVLKLAAEITKNYSNKYDKADAICKYLNTNYNYTTKIDALPEGRDAVDYFLFDQKKGYCTYFASSMAILCRSVDIPVRYVEGVNINYKQKDDDWYIVKSGASHAWTEIYLEGFGWVRMDPTPGYSDNATSWAINPYDNYGARYKSDASLSRQSKVIDVQVNNSQLGANNYSIISWIKYIFIGVALLILFVLCVTALYILNQKMIYKKSSNRQKVLINMKKILLNLEKQGYELKQGETLKEFIIKLGSNERLIGSEIPELLEWFQMVRYSKKTITEEEVIWVEHFLVKHN